MRHRRPELRPPVPRRGGGRGPRPSGVAAVALLAALAFPAPGAAAGDPLAGDRLPGDPLAGDRVDVATLDLAALLDPEVAAVTRHGERESTAPAWVFALGADELRRLRPRTLHDVLRTVPGLFAYEDGLYPLVGVRGVGLLADYSTRLLVLVDGHPLNNSVGIGQSYLGDDLPVPLSAVRRIEVIEGPVGSVYGPTAFLGVVNVVTFDPGETPASAAVSAEAGRRGMTGGAAEAAGAVSGGGVRLSGAVRASGGPGGAWTFPELALDGTRPAPAGLRVTGADAARALSVYGRAAWRALELQTACGTARRGIPTAPYSSIVGDDRNSLENRTCYAQLGWRALLEDGEVAARVAFDAFRYLDAFAYPPPPDWGVYRDDAWDRWVSAEVRGAWRLTGSSRLSAGVTGESHRTMQHAFADLPGLGAGPIRKDFRTVNAWALGEQRLGERLRLHGALTFYAHEIYGARFTPRLAAVVSAGPGDVVKLVYSEGFRAPTMAEAYYEDDTDFLANPALRPERARSLEAVWERRLGAWASLSLSGFRNVHGSLIEFVTVPAPGLGRDPDPANPADWRQQAQNGGTLRTFGGELGFTLRLVRDTVAWGGVSVQRPDGRRPPNFPAVTASATVSTRWPWRPLALTASAAALSARRKDPDALTPGARPGVPAAALLSLAALLDVPRVPGLSLELAVRGVGAERVAHPVTGDFAPITEIPEPATSVLAGLRFTR